MVSYIIFPSAGVIGTDYYMLLILSDNFERFILFLIYLCKWGRHIVWRCACLCDVQTGWHKPPGFFCLCPQWGHKHVFHTGLLMCCDELWVWFNLELPWKRVSMKDCLQWAGLWACLWGVILIKLIDVEEQGHCGGQYSLGRESWMMWVKKIIRDEYKSSQQMDMHVSASFPCGLEWGDQRLEVPVSLNLMDCNLELWVKRKATLSPPNCPLSGQFIKTIYMKLEHVDMGVSSGPHLTQQEVLTHRAFSLALDTIWSSESWFISRPS